MAQHSDRPTPAPAASAGTDASTARIEDDLCAILGSVPALFPEPLFIVDDTDRLVWMNLAMADRMCRDNALEPDYAVEWLLSQLDLQDDALMFDTGQATPSSVQASLVTLTDVLGRPEWLLVRESVVPTEGRPMRLISLQDVTAIKGSALALSEENTVLTHMLHHDFQTGLPNRLRMLDILERPGGGPAALALFGIADAERHLALHGDTAVERVVERFSADLADMMHDGVVVARVGMFRLAAFWAPRPDTDTLQELVLDAVDAARTTHEFPTGQWHMDVRATIVLENGTALPRSALLREAEAALPLTAPGTAPGAPGLHIETGQARARRARDGRMLSALESAIIGGQIEPFFQPAIAGPDNHVCHVEAMARWRHPEQGLVPPPFFLPLARRAGLSERLDLAVIEAALPATARWREGGRDLSLSVNIAPSFLEKSDACHALLELISASAVPADRVIVECSVTAPEAPVLEGLDLLRAAGLRFALDNAGDISTDPREVFALAPDIVKLSPRALLRLCGRVDDARRGTAAQADAAPDTRPRQAAVLALAHYLSAARDVGAQVIGVGVQDAEMRDALAPRDLDGLQGFVFSHPVPPARMQAWLAECADGPDGRLLLRH